MPFANEHAARLTRPGLYKRFRRENDKFASGIHAIWGIRKDNNKVELQAIRFSKDKFTVAQARKWLKDHDYKPILFEPAGKSEEEKTMIEPRAVGKMQCAFQIKAEDISNEGEFSGYGSVFGVVDSYDEVVDKGAFEETLAEHRAKGTWPKMLWQHDSREPIGEWVDMYEDQHGLFVRGKLLLSDDPKEEIAEARKAYILMRKGIVDGLSIGYRVIEHLVNQEEKVIHLTKLKLREVSPVTFPANEAALVSTVKSIRDLEGLLRDAGFSRKEATAVALHGWSALNQRDADEENAGLEAIMGSIDALIKTIHGRE